jgi:hypothetical protein
VYATEDKTNEPGAHLNGYKLGVKENGVPLVNGYNKIIFTILFFLLTTTISGFAAPKQEYLLGYVVSVDRDARQFVLRIDNRPDTPENHPDTSNRQVTVVLDENSRRPFLPNCVNPGELVRAWGNSSADPSIFKATDIRGTRGWGQDRSGVRKRLGRGRHHWGRPATGRDS